MRATRTAALLAVLASAGCQHGATVAVRSAAPTPVPTTARSATPIPSASPSASPSTATPSATPSASLRPRVVHAATPRTTRRATASPSPRSGGHAAPPHPSYSPFSYAAPTVTRTRLIGCPGGAGGSWTFKAQVTLHGGSGWRPAFANLTYSSGETYDWTETSPGNGAPQPPQQVTWNHVELYDQSGHTHTVAFPSSKVIHATCPDS